MVGRCGYCCLAYGLADYIRYLGAWDVHPLEGNPNVAFNYSTLGHYSIGFSTELCHQMLN